VLAGQGWLGRAGRLGAAQAAAREGARREGAEAGQQEGGAGRGGDWEEKGRGRWRARRGPGSPRSP
jgi:hypothetical protein